MKKLIRSGVFWTIITFIIGLILAYYWSQNKRDPVYAVKKDPSLVFDKNNASSNLKILFNDSTLINKNVYLVTLVLWNDGNLEIKKNDVRKKFIINITDDAEILDFKITQETHPGISNFKILPRENDLLLDWDYFDPGFGLELQLIYAGTNESKINIQGYVLGEDVSEVEVRQNFIYERGLTIFNIILASFLLFFMFRLKNTFSKKTEKILFGSIIVFLILGLFISTLLILNHLLKYVIPL